MFRRIVLATFFIAATVSTASAQTPNWSQTQRVEVAMSSYAYAPAELHLRHGTAYVLHFTNSAGKSHDFNAPKFFAASTIAPDDQGKIVNGGVDLDENGSADVKLIANTPGTYEVRCTYFMHAMLGMTGKVIVD